MRDRATIAGGTFSCGAAEGGGFVVEVDAADRQRQRRDPRARRRRPGGRARRILGAARHAAGHHRRRERGGRRRGGPTERRAPARRRADGRAHARDGRHRGDAADLRDGDGDGPRILILTTFDLDEYVYDALHAGASGFLLKDVPAETLFEAVRVIAAGEALLAPAITRRLIAEFARLRPRQQARPDGLAALTPRETEILGLVAEGLSNARSPSGSC